MCSSVVSTQGYWLSLLKKDHIPLTIIQRFTTYSQVEANKVPWSGAFMQKQYLTLNQSL